MRRMLLAVELALSDLRFDRMSTLTQILAFASVFGPLLILFGLKTGVIATLTGELLSDPSNRQILIVGQNSHTQERLEEMAAWPEVGFLVPHTRSLAASVTMIPGDGRRSPVETVGLLATDRGDPLLPESAPALEEGGIWVSASTAAVFDLAVGDMIRIALERRLAGYSSTQMVSLEVAGIIDLARWGARGALVSLDLLVAIEQWRDGLAVPSRGWDGRDPGDVERPFASFRLYAASLSDVRPLTDRMNAEGFQTRSQVAAVEAVQGLDRSLTAIFWIIAGATAAGFLGSFAAGLWNRVMKQRQAISLLRLQGMGRGTMTLFPVAQAVVIALLGSVMGTGFFMLAALAINAGLGDGLQVSGTVCRVDPAHILIAFLLSILVAILASTGAGVRVARADPAEGFQHA